MLNHKPSSFRWGDPSEDEARAEGQIAYAEEKTRELKDRKPADRYIRIGVVFGLVAGLAAGVLTADGNLFWIIGCILAGGILGVMLGSIIGALIARGRKKRRIDQFA